MISLKLLVVSDYKHIEDLLLALLGNYSIVGRRLAINFLVTLHNCGFVVVHYLLQVELSNKHKSHK